MKIVNSIFVVILLLGCNKEKYFAGPNTFQDSFEEYSQIEDFIDGDNVKWSFVQKTYEENQLSIDTIIYHSGGKSFRSFAIAPIEGGLTSKASINKQFMAFWQNETVAIEAWYFIEGEQDLDWLFLMDLEEKVSIGAGPGMRIALVNNQLLVEHKYPNPNLKQEEGSAVDFPRNQWVKIKLEALLSQKEIGTVKVWQDDALIIEQNNWQTLPKDVLYFIQGTKGMYDKIEFGATANASDNSATVYVDDIDVRVVE
ncbi:MAG: heparin lyase I family protein [Crocinitomicaceae bacterium]